MNLSTEKKIMDLDNTLVAARREREGVGGIGRVEFRMQTIALGMDLQ